MLTVSTWPIYHRMLTPSTFPVKVSGMGKPNSYHHHNLREALLAETAVMIAKNGVESVTMRALAERVGVSRTAPYRHFSDKTSLLTAVAEDGFKQLQQRMAAARGENNLHSFYQMGIAYIQFAVENPTRYRLMFGPEGIQRENNPALTAAADDSFAELQGVIELCQQEGIMKPDDPCLLAYAAWAMMHGAASLLIDRQTHDDIDVETFIQLTYQTLISGMMIS